MRPLFQFFDLTSDEYKMDSSIFIHSDAKQELNNFSAAFFFTINDLKRILFSLISVPGNAREKRQISEQTGVKIEDCVVQEIITQGSNKITSKILG